MRGETKKQVNLFSYVSLESRIPSDHPLREIKRLCDETLKRMCGVFDGLYSEMGRPSIPPEHLLKASCSLVRNSCSATLTSPSTEAL